MKLYWEAVEQLWFSRREEWNVSGEAEQFLLAVLESFNLTALLLKEFYLIYNLNLP